MRRGAIASVGLAAAFAISGCAGAAHHWQVDFVARLEGASAAVQESAAEFGPAVNELDLARAGLRLGPRLVFKAELIRDLDPPDDCVPIEEKGWRSVRNYGELVYDLYKNLTPELRDDLVSLGKEEAAELRSLGREAEACA